MLQTVNYDHLSDDYNKRYNSSPLEGITKEIGRLLELYNPKIIIEVGCGTGHWLSKCSGSPALSVGFDYSMGMLREAKRNQLDNLVQADAAQLPLKTDCADIIMAINAIHHFKNLPMFFKSVAESLIDGGILVIIGLNPEDKSTSWYLYDYFEGIYEYDLKRYPSFNDIQKAAEIAGLQLIEKKEVHTVSYNLQNDDITKDTFLQKNQASQLAALSEDEYAKGLNKINKALSDAKENARNIEFNVNLVFNSISLIKR